MFSTRKALFSLVLLTSLLLLAGCSLAGTPAAAAPEQQPSPDLDQVRTEAAQTVVARVTFQAALTPSATLPPPPTETPLPAPTEAAPAVQVDAPTSTAVPTLTRPVTSGGGGGSVKATATSSYTDQAKILSTSPQDYTNMPAGRDFDAVWVLKNVGKRAWDPTFYIRHAGGNLKGAKGVDATQFKRAAELGVTKINIDTDGRLVWTRVHREYFLEHPENFDLRPIGKVFMAEYAKFIVEKNNYLGSNNQIDVVRKLVSK